MSTSYRDNIKTDFNQINDNLNETSIQNTLYCVIKNVYQDLIRSFFLKMQQNWKQLQIFTHLYKFTDSMQVHKFQYITVDSVKKALLNKRGKWKFSKLLVYKRKKKKKPKRVFLPIVRNFQLRRNWKYLLRISHL